MRLRLGFSRVVAFALVAGMAVQGCGGGRHSVAVTPPGSGSLTGTAALPIGTQAGSVQFPSGAKLTGTVTVSNSLSSTTVGASGGSFSLQAFMTGPQFAVVTNSAGAPVMTGFLGPGETTINAHTTAEVLAYFAAGIFLDPPALQQQAYGMLAGAPGFAALETAVTNDIAASPGTFPATAGALKTFASSLATTSSTARKAAVLRKAAQIRRVSDILVDPSTAQSGVTVINQSPVQINFQNTFRRAALAYIDQVGYAPVQGSPNGSETFIVPAPQTDVIPAVNGTGSITSDYLRLFTSCATFSNCIPATTPLKTFSGTLTDVLYGNFAYNPVTTGNVTLTPVAGSVWTRYKVTVVGPGPQPDTGGLSNEQIAGQQEVSTLFWFTDVFMPFLTAIVMPYASDLSQSISTDDANAINDIIQTLFSNSSQIATASSNGDVIGAIWLSVAAFSSNNTLKQKVVDFLVGRAFENPAYFNGFPGQTQAEAAAIFGNDLLNATNLADALTTGFDLSVTYANLNSSNQADVYTVYAVPVKVTLTPASTNLDNDQSVHISANVPSAGSSDLVLTYTWSNTAQVGHFKDLSGNPADVDNFSSTTQNEGIYTSDATGSGTDTVSVTIGAIDSSGDKVEKFTLGSASATIAVATPSPTPTPGPLGTPPDEPQSRCASMSVSAHTADVGQTITGTAGAPVPEACGGMPGDGSVSWDWAGYYGTVISGCNHNDMTCTFTNGVSQQWLSLCLSGGSAQGSWASCDYYAFLPAGTPTSVTRAVGSRTRSASPVARPTPHPDANPPARR